jgi:hypothetical protein
VIRVILVTGYWVFQQTPPFTLQIPGNCGGGLVAQETRIIWEALYPDESFFLSETAVRMQEKRAEGTRLVAGLDLLASTEQQATFLWQVSGERFQDQDFLEEGIENYIKFVKLKPKAAKAGIVLVPTYQIDLKWHTHILSNIGDYLRGAGMHHDDSLAD